MNDEYFFIFASYEMCTANKSDVYNYYFIARDSNASHERLCLGAVSLLFVFGLGVPAVCEYLNCLMIFFKDKALMNK